MAVLSRFDNSPTARPTETWMPAILRPSLAKAKMLVWPLATPEMQTRFAERTIALATLGSPT
jgi:hypothetical protein